MRYLLIICIAILSCCDSDSQCLCKEEVCELVPTPVLVGLGQSNEVGGACAQDPAPIYPTPSGQIVNNFFGGILQDHAFDNFRIGVSDVYGALQGYEYIFKFAVSGTVIYEDPTVLDFNVNSGEYYNDILAQWNYLVNEMAKNCQTPIVDEVIILHGESDSRDIVSANAYEINLSDFINGLNAVFGGQPNWTLFNLKDSSNPPNTYHTTINTAMNNISNTIPNVEVFDTNAGTTCDNVHYTKQTIVDFANQL